MIVDEIVDARTPVFAEVNSMLIQKLKEDKSFVMLGITGGELEYVKECVGRGAWPANIRRLMDESTEEGILSFEPKGRELPWTQCYIYEPLPSTTSIFRIYVILRRPGMIEAIIEAVAEKIRFTMRNADIDTIEEVSCAPMAMCSVYVPAGEEIYRRHIFAELVKILEADHIKIDHPAHSNKNSFTCRRVG